MAFYNPQRVVFNPDSMVIQSAGKVGGVLYDVMNKHYNDKLKLHQHNKEQELKRQELEFNQAFKNNQIMQNERNFDFGQERARQDFNFKQERARQADAQWKEQMGLKRQQLAQNERLNALKEQEYLMKFNAYKNDLIKQQQEQELLNNFTNPQNNKMQDEALLNEISQGAHAQFLDNAHKQNKTYDTTHGFMHGAGQKLFGGLGSQSTDLNLSSDLFLKRVFSDLLKGGKNAKWSLENLKEQYPINGNILEANNQMIAQKLVGEWLNNMPTILENELADKLASAKTPLQRQAALNEYQKERLFYETYAPKIEAFYWDKPMQNKERVPLKQVLEQAQQPQAQAQAQA